jgi:hypothetical protein
MFGSKQKKIVSLEQAAGGLQAQVNQLNGYLQQIGGLEYVQVRQQVEQMRAELAGLQQAHAAERQAHQNVLAAERRSQEEALALQKKGFEQGLFPALLVRAAGPDGQRDGIRPLHQGL